MPAVGRGERYHLSIHLGGAEFVYAFIREAGWYTGSVSDILPPAVAAVHSYEAALDERLPQPADRWLRDEYRLDPQLLQSGEEIVDADWVRRLLRERVDPRPAISGQRAVDGAVDTVLLTLTPDQAHHVVRSFHPEWRHQAGAFRRARPIARALVARDLRSIGDAWVRRFERWGALKNTDAFLDEDGRRVAAPRRQAN